MSQENVEIVRRAYEEWNGGDIDALLSMVHSDVLFVQDRAIPGADTVEGREELRDWLTAFADAWDGFRLTPERMVPVGDRVAVIARAAAKGKSSGIELDAPVGHLFTISKGAVARWESFNEPTAVLEAVGLRE
jgi:ketosteroid isomerase-like protein